MRYEDYPYNARENECAHDADKTYGHVASYKKFHGMNDLGAMMEEVS